MNSVVMSVSAQVPGRHATLSSDPLHFPFRQVSSPLRLGTRTCRFWSSQLPLLLSFPNVVWSSTWASSVPLNAAPSLVTPARRTSPPFARSGS